MPSRIGHLVVDASSFVDMSINDLLNLSDRYYVPEDVVAELKDEETQKKVELLPFPPIVRNPAPESVEYVFQAAKKTGDFASLSVPDIKIIALTYELEKELSGEGSSGDRSVSAPIPAGPERVVPDGFASADADDEEGWISEENVETAQGLTVELEEKPVVGCLTKDFAIQNVILYLKLHLVSQRGFRITKLRSYVLRCRACYSTTTLMTKEFCPKCGNKSLYKCGISVDADGTQHLHINLRRLAVQRGLRYSMPAPKGGKHVIQEKHFEDQRLPENRVAAVKNATHFGEPFSIHDVTSRSAALGIRTMNNSAKKASNKNSGRSGRRGGHH